jgi:hypothetical protein
MRSTFATDVPPNFITSRAKTPTSFAQHPNKTRSAYSMRDECCKWATTAEAAGGARIC